MQNSSLTQALGRQLSRPTGFFGRIVSKLMDKGNFKYYLKTLEILDIKSGDKIFEIGYGPGAGISLIANNSINCTISGIDYSELMYEKAKKRNKKFIDSGIVDLRYGNILTANMNGEKYDKIFCINVIYFWSDLLPVFQKIYSILNPGGIYCIYMLHEKEIKKLKFTKEFCKYPIEEVEAGLCEAGFKSVEYKLDTGYYIKATK